MHSKLGIIQCFLTAWRFGLLTLSTGRCMTLQNTVKPAIKMGFLCFENGMHLASFQSPKESAFG